MERDLQKVTWKWCFCHFNSHAHVERDSIMPFIGFSPINFDSHAYVERDAQTFVRDMVTKISTHTLTWSVTLSSGQFNSTVYISTHTLTWSVTCYIIIIFCHFFISTHTLTWSVTNFDALTENIIIFQLTRSRGAWLVCSKIHSNGYHFNSHAHVERDWICVIL